ncbi:MAG: oligosaccharide flippase family protein [Bacteroidales bacterium]|nr:oligosaccharide flippase family protein [Bacteroidales bacterium]
MNPLKKLAGETAVYGLSTILARVINFIFVPIYTRMLSTGSYGIAVDFLAYIAILQVILTLGLETGCFNFANKHHKPNTVFSNALITTGALSAIFFVFVVIFSGQISAFYSLGSTTATAAVDYSGVILFVGSILAIDSFTSILFAKLRFEHKALKFATFKTIKILSETIFNFLLFFGAPAYISSNPETYLLNFISATPDFNYIIFAIFLSCIVSITLFIPDLIRIKLTFNRKLWREMMLYSLPLMIAGLPGILNDFVDRIMFRFFSPAGNIWESDLGIFGAWVKFATIMMLFIQMFRFAAEPFFFSRVKEERSKELYASVMEHFTAFCMLIFLSVLLYLDIISLIIGSEFQAGKDIVPVMLMAYVILGMNFNVSMWYKLSGKTNFAIYITMAGLAVTLFVNIKFMPLFSYHAAAWGHLLSYLTMFIISITLGSRYYPIPYRWSKIGTFIAAGIALYLISYIYSDSHIIVRYTLNTLLIILYIALYLKIEKISVWKLKF